jgi:hypothetical protein
VLLIVLFVCVAKLIECVDKAVENYLTSLLIFCNQRFAGYFCSLFVIILLYIYDESRSNILSLCSTRPFNKSTVEYMRNDIEALKVSNI